MLAIGASTHLRACWPSGSHGYARESAMEGRASGRAHLLRFVGVSLTNSPALTPAKLPRSISACPNRRAGGCGHSLSDAYFLHAAWIGRAPCECNNPLVLLVRDKLFPPLPRRATRDQFGLSGMYKYGARHARGHDVGNRDFCWIFNLR